MVLKSVLLALVSSMAKRVFGLFAFLRSVAWEVLWSRCFLQRLQWEPWLGADLWCFAAFLSRVVGLDWVIKKPLVLVEVIPRLGFGHSRCRAESPLWHVCVLEWLVLTVVDWRGRVDASVDSFGQVLAKEDLVAVALFGLWKRVLWLRLFDAEWQVAERGVCSL